MRFLLAFVVVLSIVFSANGQPPTPSTGFSYSGACGSTTVTRVVNPPASDNADWYWQTSPTGQSLTLGSQASLTVTSGATIYLHARSKSSPFLWGGVISTGPIAVATAPPPAPTIIHEATRLGPGEATISVDPVPGATSYKWIRNPKAILLDEHRNFYYISDLIGTSFFEVSAVNACGESGQVHLNATVIPLPWIRATNNGIFNMGSSMTLYVDPVYDSYEWRYEGGSVFATTDKIVVDKPGDYTITVYYGGDHASATYRTVAGLEGQDANFIATNTPQQKTQNEDDLDTYTASQLIQNVAYYDGLGNLSEEVTTQGSPTHTDVVKAYVFDGEGKRSESYLPYAPPLEQSGVLKPYAESDIRKFYEKPPAGVASDERAYQKTTFENSPLSRPLKVFGVGKDWLDKNKFVSYDYRGNMHGTGTDQEKIIAWAVNASGMPVKAADVSTYTTSGFYDQGQLRIKVTTNESGFAVREYYDKSDRLILKKIQAVKTPAGLNNMDQWALTYYVFDDLGNLAYVLPPELSKLAHQSDAYVLTPDDLKLWAFAMKYDEKKRLIQKTQPGSEAVYFVYDSRDRLVLRQDGNLRKGKDGTALKKWLFTKYDIFGRPVLTGIYTTSTEMDQAALQIAVDQFYQTGGGIPYETYQTAAANVHGYTYQSFPASVIDPDDYLTVTYYDNYRFMEIFRAQEFDYNPDMLPAAGTNPGLDPEENQRVVGYITGSQTRMLTSATWLRGVSYYDNKNRVIQQISENIKGVDVTSTVYDFNDRVVRSHHGFCAGLAVAWTSLTNASLTGQTLSGTNTSPYSGGARSTQTLPVNSNGWVEFTVDKNVASANVVVGLNDADDGQGYTNMDFCIMVRPEGASAYENGVIKGNSVAILPGDVLRIERVNNKIYYKRNGLIFYTSAATTTASFIVDASFQSSAAHFSNPRVSPSFSGLSTLTQQSTERYVYDHVGRLTQIWHRTNTEDEILLMKQDFNELGQLLTKRLHKTDDTDYTPVTTDPLVGQAGVIYGDNLTFSIYQGAPAAVATKLISLKPGFRVPSGSSFVARIGYSETDAAAHNEATNFAQTIDYRYNIRGWISRINNSDLTPDANNDPPDYFGLNLAYNEDLGTGNADPALDLRKYDGNVSAVKWSNQLGLGTVKEMAYNFAYDPMQRLSSADHRESTTPGVWTAGEYHEKEIAYDLNGNIQALQRYGEGGVQIDNLAYDYGAGTLRSNKLLSVTDNTTNPDDKRKGFFDGAASTTPDYTYDRNGNMTLDNNKGFSSDVVYNFLNLPEEVSRGGAVGQELKVTNLYDASGKLHARVSRYNQLWKSTEYVGGWVYENDQPLYLQHSEGRVALSEKNEVYIHHADDVSGLIATGSVTLTPQTVGDQGYIKVTPTTGVQVSGLGIASIGGSFTVSAGERYIYRVKGYSAGLQSYLNVTGNTADVSAYMARMSTDTQQDLWTEVIFTVPEGVSQIQTGVVFSAQVAAAGNYMMINEVQLIKVNAVDPEYQYAIKDHLGNTRVTFTTRTTSQTSLATLETSRQVSEESDFIHYDETKRVNHALWDHTHSDSTHYAMRLTGSEDSEHNLAKTLSVMPGDVVHMEVFAKYLDTDRNNWTEGLKQTVAAMALQTMPGGIDGAGITTTQEGVNPLALVSGAGDNGDRVPNAYLNYILYDRTQTRVLASGYRRVTREAREYGQNAAHERLAFDGNEQIEVQEPGYLYVYLSNESPSTEVYFDDLRVTLMPSKILQIDDYYPFGLAYNSYQRENSIHNSWQFQGQEHLDDLGLNWDAFRWRNYQPDIGRFFNMDPLADKFYYNSPYAFSENKVTIHRELEGLEALPVNNSNPLYTMNAYMLQYFQGYGRLIDRAFVSVSSTTTTVIGNIKATFGFGEVTIKSSIERSNTTTARTNFGGYLQYNNTNSPNQPLFQITNEVQTNQVTEVKGAVTIDGIELESGVVTKINLETGEPSVSTETAAGLDAAALFIEAETTNTSTKVDLGVKAEVGTDFWKFGFKIGATIYSDEKK